MITFREIDKSNYMECICLKVKDEQRGFVADNARSLAEARFEEGLYTRAVYSDGGLCHQRNLGKTLSPSS